MRALARTLARTLATLALVSAPAFADVGALTPERALARSLAAVGNATGDHRFVTSDGETITLGRFRGRPLLLSLVFTSCDHSCSVMTRSLAGRVAAARDALGEDSFRVVTVGFDTASDTPERMRAYARRQGVSMEGWYFLSADAATIERLMDEVGFSAVPSSRGFDHLAQTTVLDAEGRVYRQIHGEVFELPVLVEPLKELLYGRATLRPQTLTGWLDGLRLLCTVYDPAAGRYRFDWSIAVTIATGVLCLGGLLVFLVRAWRESRPGHA